MDIASALAPFLPDGALSDSQLSQVSIYLDLLLKWNAKINLTAVRAANDILTRHFGESFFLAHQLRNHQITKSPNHQVIDLGSGAGFPGLPLKIYEPNLAVTLIESNQKKATFLREVIRTLKLTGVNVFAARAEDFCSFQIPQFRTSAVPQSNEQMSQSANEQILVTLRAVEHFDRVLPLAAQIANHKSQIMAPQFRSSAVPQFRSVLALLIGSSQVATAHRLLPNFSWNAPVPIPLSRSRILLFGYPSSG